MKNKKAKQRYGSEICTDDMTFEDCELAILRQAVDETELQKQEEIAKSEDVMKMITIVEEFLREKGNVCYGGTAINNILPEEAQFYNRDAEVPDYDFYSPTPLAHAKELADIFYKEGYTDVEAKAGVHKGTFKVFVNFIAMADITELHEDIFTRISSDAIEVDGIKYAPPNFLRMNMFLELSRPNGDISRWEKVLKRLTLLNAHYPLKSKHCYMVDFQRSMDSMTSKPENSERIYYLTRDHFIDHECVFFGGYASSLYTRYMPKSQKRLVRTIPDFDVLHEDPDKCASLLLSTLKQEGITNVTMKKHEAIGEIIPHHIELLVNKDTFAFIYAPNACHSYNELFIRNKKIRVATIDTMLMFYLAFYFADKEYYSHHKERLLCMSQFLYMVQQKNRLGQQGLLKRFSMKCYGKQSTLETIRGEKTKKFKELKQNRNTPEYEYWFLRYNPVPKSNIPLDKELNIDSKASINKKRSTSKLSSKLPSPDKDVISQERKSPVQDKDVLSQERKSPVQDKDITYLPNTGYRKKYTQKYRRKRKHRKTRGKMRMY